MKLINFLHQQPFRTTAFLKYGPCPGSFFILKLYNFTAKNAENIVSIICDRYSNSEPISVP